MHNWDTEADQEAQYSLCDEMIQALEGALAFLRAHAFDEDWTPTFDKNGKVVLPKREPVDLAAIDDLIPY